MAEQSDSETEPRDQSAACLPRKRVKRVFNEAWKSKWTWLEHKDNHMFCTLCVKSQKKNVFTEGCSNFRTATLERHASAADHCQSVQDEISRSTLSRMVKNQFSENDSAIIHALRTINFLAKQDIATSKYPDFVDFLIQQGCRAFAPIAKSCQSYTITKDFQESIYEVILRDMRKMLTDADYIFVLCDESCDITSTKKLSVYARISSGCKPETIFLENCEILGGKADTIATSVKNLLTKFEMPPDRVVGLGSDGASVMTRKHNGVGTRLKREINPQLIQLHCIAHQLALVSSQYLKTYQEFMTNIYYWFKHSAKRISGLASLQDVLDAPKIRINTFCPLV
ncbi:transmembrane protein C17orf113-like [Lingula anatina]|uniref:Transmembrane protein C17orf113-like n=1 Tax=Lingula anatina TaxID=7574 RepID=A0A1S3HVL1_LINAN|nr:transmembrane protein C17orf113-like [Lingula anatina]|eukprot:XP_013390063.1 transmembrane protein C17orf113-like [Lingula anatina]